MALPKKHKDQITETIKVCLRQKFLNYKPETENMPFHFRLLGKDRMALFSFIQSLNTTFGISIYEPVAKELAKGIFKEVHSQFMLGKIITDAAQNEIQEIMNDLSVGGDVNKADETGLEKLHRKEKRNNSSQ
jgi:type II restriction enzyme